MTKPSQGLLRRFAPYFYKHRWIVALDLFFAAMTTLCEIVLPLLVRNMATLGAQDLGLLTSDVVLKTAGIYLALRVVDMIATYYMAYIGHKMGVHIETDMRADLFHRLQEQSFSYFNSTKIGQLMARITSDLFDVTEFAHHCPEEFFIGALKIVASFVILCQIHVPLTVILYLFVPLIILSLIRVTKKLKSTGRVMRQHTGEVNARVEDSLLGIRVVKAFAGEDLERKKFAQSNHEWATVRIANYFWLAVFHSISRVFDGLMYLALILAGGMYMVKGEINPADFITYLLYVTTLLTTIRRITEFAEAFQRGVTGIERFFEVMDAPIDITDPENALDLPQATGNVRFENVNFAYADDPETPVLQHLDLDIHAGQNFALVGASGGGKTTICNLIPRFYDVTSGRVLIDGHDVRTLSLHSLRQQVGIVQQDVYLFSGTIAENIAYGKPDSTREQIIEVAKLAGAHEFIEHMPNGYDTYVGERGMRLSGGQKQRISIARVFLKNPPILILDEATSALDNQSERLVQQSLDRLSQGRTVITIAHRLSTIRRADRIVVLTENGIAEQGTHQELLERNGAYAELIRLAQGS